MRSWHYPFSAIVGQEQVKKALEIALVNSRAGGLLISGASGTGKSLIVRATAPFTLTGSIVELPLSATEDMVFGSLDMEMAMKQGDRRLRKGLLQRAKDTLLYMDEVNLLREDILRAVMRVAGSGEFFLERDGLSFREKLSYTPIGTMNPAEGTLSPALLYSFGMFVVMEDIAEPDLRTAISRRAVEHGCSASIFYNAYREQEKAFAERLELARELLPKVDVPRAILNLVAVYVSEANCVGNRAELYLIEAGRALAALAGRAYVMPRDIEFAAELVLVHRLNKAEDKRPEPPGQGDMAEPDSDSLENSEADGTHDNNTDRETADTTEHEENLSTKADNNDDDSRSDDNDATPENSENRPKEPDNKQSSDEDSVATPLANVMARLSLLNMKTKGSRQSKGGKRDIIELYSPNGRTVRTQQQAPRTGKRLDLALAATLRAAAPYQSVRQGEQAIVIYAEDIRTWIRAKRSAANILFLVDASGSMGARERMRVVKGAIIALLQEAYQKRDMVGMIAFRRDRAETILPLTRSVELAEKKLRDLPTGGRTPIAEGLAVALDNINRLKGKSSGEIILIIVTDGRANKDDTGNNDIERAIRVANKIGETEVIAVILDTEQGMPRVGIAPRLAKCMGASYHTLDKLSTEGVIDIVRKVRPQS